MERKEIFSIKKLKVGAASVLIGTGIVFLGTTGTVYAADAETSDKVTETTVEQVGKDNSKQGETTAVASKESKVEEKSSLKEVAASVQSEKETTTSTLPSESEKETTTPATTSENSENGNAASVAKNEKETVAQTAASVVNKKLEENSNQTSESSTSSKEEKVTDGATTDNKEGRVTLRSLSTTTATESGSTSESPSDKANSENSNIVWTKRNGNTNLILDKDGLLTIEPVAGTDGKLDSILEYGYDKGTILEEKITDKEKIKKIVVKDGVKGNKNMQGAFYRFYNVEELDLSGLDTSDVEDMKWMLSTGIKTKKLTLGENFDTSKVKNMEGLFDNLHIKSLTLGEKFNTKNVTDMSSMFYAMSELEYLDLGKNFDTSNVKDMSTMFTALRNLKYLNLGENFDTSNVEDMRQMFFEVSSLENLNLGSKFNTKNVKNMETLFFAMRKLKKLDLGENFDTSSAENMSSMFASLWEVKTLDLGDKFNTSKAKNMEDMFYGMSNLEKLNLGENFDTSNVQNMSGMFSQTSKLKTLNLGSKFRTENVTKMIGMFQKTGIENLNLGDKFDTSKVTDMSAMFAQSNNEFAKTNLGNINLGDKFIINNNTNTEDTYYKLNLFTKSTFKSITLPARTSVNEKNIFDLIGPNLKWAKDGEPVDNATLYGATTLYPAGTYELYTTKYVADPTRDYGSENIVEKVKDGVQEIKVGTKQEKAVTRTIKYVDAETKKPIRDSKVQSVTLTNVGTVDEKTGSVTPGVWSTGEFEAIANPTIENYTAPKLNQVARQEATEAAGNIEVAVEYPQEVEKRVETKTVTRRLHYVKLDVPAQEIKAPLKTILERTITYNKVTKEEVTGDWSTGTFYGKVPLGKNIGDLFGGKGEIQDIPVVLPSDIFEKAETTDEGLYGHLKETITSDDKDEDVYVYYGSIEKNSVYVNYTTEYKADSTLPLGDKKVVQQGQGGEKLRTVTYFYNVDTNKIENRVEEKDIKDPVAEIINVGVPREEKVITRTVNFVDDKGNAIKDPVVQKVTLEKVANFDEKTGSVIEGTWTKGVLDAVTAPTQIDDKYELAEETTNKNLGKLTVDKDYNDVIVNVAYKPIIEKIGTEVRYATRTINYVDAVDGHKVAPSVEQKIPFEGDIMLNKATGEKILPNFDGEGNSRYFDVVVSPTVEGYDPVDDILYDTPQNPSFKQVINIKYFKTVPEEKVVTRTIHYVDVTTGKEIKEPTVQKVTLERFKVKAKDFDETYLDGEIAKGRVKVVEEPTATGTMKYVISNIVSYGPWSTGELATVEVPQEINGYERSLTGSANTGKVDVDGNSEDINVVINYTQGEESVTEEKTVTRTIKYIDAVTKKEIAPNEVETVKLSRTNIRNKVTNEVTKGTWNESSWKEVTSPTFENYNKPTIEKVGSEKVTAETNNKEVNVYYGKTITTSTPIAYTTIYKEDKTKEVGYRNVEVAGKDGVETTTITYTPNELGEVSEGKAVTQTPAVEEIVIVGTKDKIETKELDFATKYIADESLEAGTREESKGEKGLVTTTTTYTLDKTSGKVKENTPTTVTTEAKDSVIRVGTKPKVETTTEPIVVTYEEDKEAEAGSKVTTEEGKEKTTTKTTTYTLNAQDGTVSASDNTVVEAGKPKVVKVGTKAKVETQVLPFTKEVRNNRKLTLNELHVVQEGRDGKVETTTTYTLNSKTGEVVGNSTTITTPAIPQITEVGTYVKDTSEELPVLLTTRHIDKEGKDLFTPELGFTSAKEGVFKVGDKEYTLDNTLETEEIRTYIYKEVVHDMKGDGATQDELPILYTTRYLVKGTNTPIADVDLEYKEPKELIVFEGKLYEYNSTVEKDNIRTHYYTLVEATTTALVKKPLEQQQPKEEVKNNIVVDKEVKTLNKTKKLPKTETTSTSSSLSYATIGLIGLALLRRKNKKEN